MNSHRLDITVAVALGLLLVGCPEDRDDDVQGDDDAGDDDDLQDDDIADDDSSCCGDWDGSLAMAGDLDGDGMADLLVGDGEGSVGDHPGGAVYVFHGPLATGELDLATRDAVLIGEQKRDRAGETLAGAGDVDGDGFGDLVIGAPGVEPGGAFYVVRGPLSGVIALDSAASKVVSTQGGLALGTAIDAGGDVDADGVPDVLVGAPGHRVGSDAVGAAFLYCGDLEGEIDHDSATATLIGEADMDQAGDAVAIPGDVDGDGFADVLIGAVFNDTSGFVTGAAYVQLGPISGTVELAQADVTLYGSDVDHRFGTAVAGAGDVNGDGITDFMVGSESEACGVVYGFHGPPSPGLDLSQASWVIRGGSDCMSGGPADFGRNPTAAGDVDGDGLDDILLGSPYAENDFGPDGVPMVYILLGPLAGDIDLGTTPDVILLQSTPDSEQFGLVLAGGDDLDGDGLDDVVVGAPAMRIGQPDDWPGRVYVYSGS